MNNKAINKLRQILIQDSLDAILIGKTANVSYLSRFRGEGWLLISQNEKYLIVDFRFWLQARQEARSFTVYRRQSFLPLVDSVAALIKKIEVKTIGFEAPVLPYELYCNLNKKISPVKLVPTDNIVEQLRAIKSPYEIKLLRKSASLADKSMAFARKIIKPGRKESDIADEVQYFMKRQGACASAFEIIVASGSRNSWPHARASQKVIETNEAILVDLGCCVSGYNSDLTRMIFLGKIRSKIKHIYEVVLRAQLLAIRAVRAGAQISQVDKAARQYIAAAGLGAGFGHALGHGIGREVHEFPAVSPENHHILREAMIVTLEPAVYLPGAGGVRIEDMVLVTKTGCEILTKTQK